MEWVLFEQVFLQGTYGFHLCHFLLHLRNLLSTAPIPACVHGGTTASVVVIFGGRYAVTANVGDSSVVLCGLGNDACERAAFNTAWKEAHGDIVDVAGVNVDFNCSALRASVRGGVGSGAGKSPPPPNTAAAAAAASSNTSSSSAFLPASTSSAAVISAEHSPENAGEFYRVRRTRPRPGGASIKVAGARVEAAATEAETAQRDGDDGGLLDRVARKMSLTSTRGDGLVVKALRPSLRFVYDSPSFSKYDCPPIFAVDKKTGLATVTNKGRCVHCSTVTATTAPRANSEH